MDPAVLYQVPSANVGNVNILRADIDRNDAVNLADRGIIMDPKVLYAACP
jgi:hypothetical protein